MDNEQIYVKAEFGKMNGKNTVSYTGAGRRMFRMGGTRGWRNSNPGNIKYGRTAISLGAIGQDADGFAIFPDFKTGDYAQEALLKGGSFGGLSIDAAIRAYTQGDPDEIVKNYISHVTKSSGIAATKKINEMTDAEFTRFRDAMKVFEDNAPGTEVEEFDDGKDKAYRIFDYYLKDPKKSHKDFSNYDIHLAIKNEYPTEFIRVKATREVAKQRPIPVKQMVVPKIRIGGTHTDVRQQPSQTSGGSHSGDTLERHGNDVYRIEGDGSTRGSFHSQ